MVLLVRPNNVGVDVMLLFVLLLVILFCLQFVKITKYGVVGVVTVGVGDGVVLLAVC